MERATVHDYARMCKNMEGYEMTVNELKKVLEKFPEDEEVIVLYPEDNYGDDSGVILSEVAYITGTESVRSGVYIKLG